METQNASLSDTTWHAIVVPEVIHRKTFAHGTPTTREEDLSFDVRDCERICAQLPGRAICFEHDDQNVNGVVTDAYVKNGQLWAAFKFDNSMSGRLLETFVRMKKFYKEVSLTTSMDTITGEHMEPLELSIVADPARRGAVISHGETIAGSKSGKSYRVQIAASSKHKHQRRVMQASTTQAAAAAAAAGSSSSPLPDSSPTSDSEDNRSPERPNSTEPSDDNSRRQMRPAHSNNDNNHQVKEAQRPRGSADEDGDVEMDSNDDGDDSDTTIERIADKLVKSNLPFKEKEAFMKASRKQNLRAREAAKEAERQRREAEQARQEAEKLRLEVEKMKKLEQRFEREKSNARDVWRGFFADMMGEDHPDYDQMVSALDSGDTDDVIMTAAPVLVQASASMRSRAGQTRRRYDSCDDNPQSLKQRRSNSQRYQDDRLNESSSSSSSSSSSTRPVAASRNRADDIDPGLQKLLLLETYHETATKNGRSLVRASADRRQGGVKLEVDIRENWIKSYVNPLEGEVLLDSDDTFMQIAQNSGFTEPARPGDPSMVRIGDVWADANNRPHDIRVDDSVSGMIAVAAASEPGRRIGYAPNRVSYKGISSTEGMQALTHPGETWDHENLTRSLGMLAF